MFARLRQLRLCLFSALFAATLPNRAQLTFEKPDVLEQTYPMPVTQVYSDRKGHVFVADSFTTKMVTSNGFKALPLMSPVAVQPDGGIVGRLDRTRVLNRIPPDGSSDSFLAPQVNDGDTDFFNAVAAQPDGKLIVACGPRSFGTDSPCEGINQGLFRLNADGSFDPTFKMSKGPFYGLYVFSDGSFLANQGGISKFLPDGSRDPNFTVSVTDGATDFDLQPDGKIIIAGAFGSVNGTYRPNLARLFSSGGFDPSFGPEPLGFGMLRGARVQSDGSVIIQSAGRVGKLTLNGTLDPTFPPKNASEALRGIGVDQSDRIYFNDGDNLKIYSGRLRMQMPAQSIPVVFEKATALDAAWTPLQTVPANMQFDYLLPSLPGPGNAFFRVRAAQ
jgi:uncharacterized delta-60 repeat protein